MSIKILGVVFFHTQKAFQHIIIYVFKLSESNKLLYFLDKSINILLLYFMVLSFSYIVEDICLLNKIIINNSCGEVLLITGKINKNLSVLAGILAGLIPASEDIDVEQLVVLLRAYHGKIIVHQGDIKEYYLIGEQPDRHFVFSKVYEEFIGRTKLTNQTLIIESLMSVGLDESFYFRKISSLSGGEKIKLALALSKVADSERYLFYNTIPWLDEEGRMLFFRLIKELKSKNKEIIIFEQEYDFLSSLIDKISFFEGSSLNYSDSNKTTNKEYVQLANLLKYLKSSSHSSNKKSCILSFDNILFSTYPESEKKIDKNTGTEYPLLDHISFKIFKGHHLILSGENGSGKSTIFNLCFRLLKPDKGEITLLDKPLNTYSRNEINKILIYISQFPQYQMIYHTFGEYKKLIKSKKLLKFIEKHCPYDEDYSVMQLSFFEMKLILLLTGIKDSSELIILDEPSWALDKEQILTFINILIEVCQEYNLTIFAVTHSKEFLKIISFDTVKICKGKLIYED